jgi:hypothetical protein
MVISSFLFRSKLIAPKTGSSDPANTLEKSNASIKEARRKFCFIIL